MMMMLLDNVAISVPSEDQTCGGLSRRCHMILVFLPGCTLRLWGESVRLMWERREPADAKALDKITTQSQCELTLTLNRF